MRWKAFRESVWGLLPIVVVMGGIYSGVFTPNEAAAMSAVYAFVVAVFVYNDLKLKDVAKTLLASANMSAMLLYIITNAILFPIAMEPGIDPIHIGVMVTVHMQIGMITPPVGLNLYVASGISKLGLTEMPLAAGLWLVTMLVVLVLITCWPPLSLWLPRTLGML